MKLIQLTYRTLVHETFEPESSESDFFYCNHNVLIIPMDDVIPAYYNNFILNVTGGVVMGIVLLFLITVYYRSDKSIEKSSIFERSSNLHDTVICSSANCIRCSQNHDILKKALTKLSYFSDTDNHVLTHVECVSKDIKKSIKFLKSNNDLQKSSATFQQSKPVVFKMSGINDKEIWSPNDFPALQILDQSFESICFEFNELYKNRLKNGNIWKINSTNSGRWEIAHLINQGRVTEASILCPMTFEVLKKIPYFLENNVFGDASFSVVHAGTDIDTHCGSTNLRIRCHLGLKVPGKKCYLKIGDKICYWEERKVLCFNDAFPHSVHHKGQDAREMRVVFMFDVWHPEITDSQRQILNYAFDI